MATILIVDDTIFMRTSLKKIVTEAGHTVVGEAGNGKDAYWKYKELKPDIVLMDITMPEVDGIDGLRHIKQDFPEAVVIMVSAMGQQDLVVEAIEGGAADFVVKPFTEDRVIAAINKVLQQKA
jgi:two-component system chemotaxis response regulator CheY